MTSSEKKIPEKIATRVASELKMPVSELAGILDRAKVEVYQENPYTTVVIKSRVDGKSIRAAGFCKYNPNDAQFGSGHYWNESIGRNYALSRAYRAFAKELKDLSLKRRTVRVKAIVENSGIPTRLKENIV